MQAEIKETEWYKNITKGFIDTNPPKPVAPVKKCHLFKIFLFEQIK